MRAILIGVTALALVSCGGNPSGPSTPPLVPGEAIFGLIPNAITLGPGDAVQVYGLAARNASAPGDDVTATMRLSSANPSVARVDGTQVIGVAPGETDITATYQTLTTTAHVTVFAPSAVTAVNVFGFSACWPNDTLEFQARAILENGAEIFKPPVTWSSTNPDVAQVDQAGRVKCAAPGATTIRGTYQGRTGSSSLTVRVPQDTLELRGSGRTGIPARGNTVTLDANGFYVVESAASAVIQHLILDSDGSLLVTGQSVTVPRGSGPWNVKATFVVPAKATALCSRITMELIGSASKVPPVWGGGCDTVR